MQSTHPLTSFAEVVAKHCRGRYRLKFLGIHSFNVESLVVYVADIVDDGGR